MTKSLYLTFKQRLEINDKLQELLTTPVDGRVQYKNPHHSDAEVVKLLGFCNTNNVASVRKEMFGKLISAKGTLQSSNRISHIENYHNKLVKFIRDEIVITPESREILQGFIIENGEEES